MRKLPDVDDTQAWDDEAAKYMLLNYKVFKAYIDNKGSGIPSGFLAFVQLGFDPGHPISWSQGNYRQHMNAFEAACVRLKQSI